MVDAPACTLQVALATNEELKRQLGRMQVDSLSAEEGVAEEKQRLLQALHDTQQELEAARADAEVMHEALQVCIIQRDGRLP